MTELAVALVRLVAAVLLELFGHLLLSLGDATARLVRRLSRAVRRLL